MKNFYPSSLYLYIFLLFIIGACSSEDDTIDPSNDMFLKTIKNGVPLIMDSQTASFEVNKIINSSGILQLEVKVVNADESVRFILPYYSGKNMYVIGQDSRLPNLMEYEIAAPYGKWLCNHPGLSTLDKNYIEITQDDGRFIEGKFSFTAQNQQNLNFIKFSEGSFKLEN